MLDGEIVRSSGPIRIATGAQLSLDFNPRDLVAFCPGGALPVGAAVHSDLDAIYVPTKGRRDYLLQLLPDLRLAGAPVFLLPTSESDVPVDHWFAGQRLDCLCVRQNGFLEVLHALRCTSDPIFAVPQSDWDLPIKRNYALWHARKNGFDRILLLDDDIQGLDASRIQAGAAALSDWTIAGYFVEDFPDTSVLGHVELAVGEPLFPFLSGSCLFLRSDQPLGFFPPIYNEDWILMAPAIARRQVCSLGVVRQQPIDPFARSALSDFQEPGEVIADGLFALLAAGQYEARFELSVWETILYEHRTWLTLLADRATDARHRSAVTVALDRCNQLDAGTCAAYIGILEEDRVQWNRALEELR